MSILLYILMHNIIPVFTVIILGFLLSKKFDLNISTLSKLNIYLFVPGYIFVNLYTTNLNMDLFKIIYFCTAYMIFNDLLARVIARFRKYDVGLTNAFKNSILFNNSGNIGLSLVTLVFGSVPFVINGEAPYLSEAIAAQIMVLVFMNVTNNTIGFYNAGRASLNFKDSITKIFKMPAIYIIPITLLFKYTQVDITITPLWPAMVYIKDGLVPVSLLTLGVQLSKTDFNFKNIDVHIAVFIRLIVGPILAVAFIYIFGFTGITAQTLLIAYSVPTAVTTALVAVEWDNNPGFASQVVMVSTIFSAVSLAIAVYAARLLFPV